MFNLLNENQQSLILSSKKLKRFSNLGICIVYCKNDKVVAYYEGDDLSFLDERRAQYPMLYKSVDALKRNFEKLVKKNDGDQNFSIKLAIWMPDEDYRPNEKYFELYTGFVSGGKYK